MCAHLQQRYLLLALLLARAALLRLLPRDVLGEARTGNTVFGRARSGNGA
jgi:hypothetical protein